MNKQNSSTIADSGLRYVQKAAGSPFNDSRLNTMSCTMCGKHKLRTHGGFKTLAGKPMFFCFDCKPKK